VLTYKLAVLLDIVSVLWLHYITLPVLLALKQYTDFDQGISSLPVCFDQKRHLALLIS